MTKRRKEERIKEEREKIMRENKGKEKYERLTKILGKIYAESSTGGSSETKFSKACSPEK